MPDRTVKLENFLQNISLENFLQDMEVGLCGVLQDAGLPYIPSDYLTKDGRPSLRKIRDFGTNTPGIGPALGMFFLLHRLRRQIASLPERSQAVDDTILTALLVGLGYMQAAKEMEWKDDAERGFTARRTLALANHDRHLETEALWTPLLEEFRELCADGMKRDTARSEILKKWPAKDAPTMKTARKWLCDLDGEAD